MSTLLGPLQIMGDFFHGWRRKLGVLTLLMACVFAAAWIRSEVSLDTLTRNSKQARISIDSCQGSIGLALWTPGLVGEPGYFKLFGGTYWWASYDSNGVDAASDGRPPWRYDVLQATEIDWRWDFLGFTFGESKLRWPLSGLVKAVAIPYWFIEVFLIGFSAWLLLSKPRVAKPNPVKTIP